MLQHYDPIIESLAIVASISSIHRLKFYTEPFPVDLLPSYPVDLSINNRNTPNIQEAAACSLECGPCLCLACPRIFPLLFYYWYLMPAHTVNYH